MYTNRSRTFLGATSIISFVIAVFLFFAQGLRSSVASSCVTAMEDCGDTSSVDISGFAIGFAVLGIALGIGYLVARSASYDIWYRANHPNAPLKEPPPSHQPAEWESDDEREPRG